VTTYSVAPNDDDTPTLWRAESEHDQYPQPLAFMTSVGNTATDNCDDHGVVFRAAAAVLAPEEAVERLIRLAISDPGAFVKRVMDTGEGYHEPVTRWSARAVQHALRTHIEEAKP
jgi:hypothetical protein